MGLCLSLRLPTDPLSPGVQQVFAKDLATVNAHRDTSREDGRKLLTPDEL